MRKRILIILIIVGFNTMHSNAQVSYGIKVENNISILLYDNIPNYKNDLGDGIGIGGFLKIDLAKHFAIQPELLFQFLSSTMENDFKYWGMELPVYAVGQLQLVNGNMMYIGIGPYIGLGFRAKDSKTGQLFKKGERDLSMKRINTGIGTIIGYETNIGIQGFVSYKYGLANRLNATSNNSKMRGHIIAIGMGYRF